MESSRTTPSLGRRFMLMVILGAVLPLGLLGMWVTRSAARSGRSLLHSQLEAEVSDAARALNQRWQHYRSDLLTLGESNPVRLALLDTASANQDVPAYVQRMFARMPAFDRIEIRDRHGRTRFALESMEQRLTRAGLDAEQRGDTRGVPVRLPITDLVTGDTIGSIDASVRAGVLLPAATELASPSGPLTAIFASGRGVVPAGADEQLFSDDDVEWGGHRWLTVRRSVADPGVEVAVARALDPYVRPFERTARRGTDTLLLAAGGIVLMLVILTRRMTAVVERDLAQR